MGRSPCCCHDAGVKKGPWTEDEDRTLVEHIQKHGGHVSSWRNLPKAAGLNRCGKSCRLRWTNYLRPDIKRGNFTDDEERLIIALHADLGNKWSTIATHLEGRTDNEIKNYWNTHIRKKLVRMGFDPVTHQRLPSPDVNNILNGALLASSSSSSSSSPRDLLCAAANLDNALRQAQAIQLLLQLVGGSSNNNGSAALLGSNNYGLVAGNAMLNASNSVVAPNFQDQMMMNIFLQSQASNNRPAAAGSYPGAADAAKNNFAEQGMAQQQQCLNYSSSGPSPSDSPNNNGEPAADQYCCNTTAALERPADYPQEVAVAGVDMPLPVQSFTDLLELEPQEMPSLYSLEDDRFWDDMLDSSFPL
ncbi:hypothetical protein QOZ80_4AG0305620 [Eleusine coracana subsp. coracana]|nr:hypothetical protein QOZ80_4AG0305620 [Eleusine coracana subsp. coracana]